MTAWVGCAAAVVAAMLWYRGRCRRGATDIPGRAALAACLTLPAGNICWAIFVDAVPRTRRLQVPRHRTGRGVTPPHSSRNEQTELPHRAARAEPQSASAERLKPGVSTRMARPGVLGLRIAGEAGEGVEPSIFMLAN